MVGNIDVFTSVSMRSERLKKNHQAIPQIIAKAIEIENYPKLAHGAMLRKKVLLKIAKQKVNKNYMICKNNISLL